jgi:hypothetical protein
MHQTNTALSPSLREPSADVPREPVVDEIQKLLLAAAALAASQGLATEMFMNAAWTACLDARPGLREELADKELKSQIRKLRRRGLVGQA